jgi:hypothetical protein
MSGRTMAGGVAELVEIESGVVSRVSNPNDSALARDGDHAAMGRHDTESEALHSTADATHHLFEDWFDPIEMGIRARVRGSRSRLSLRRRCHGHATAEQHLPGPGMRPVDIGTATDRAR